MSTSVPVHILLSQTIYNVDEYNELIDQSRVVYTLPKLFVDINVALHVV